MFYYIQYQGLEILEQKSDTSPLTVFTSSTPCHTAIGTVRWTSRREETRLFSWSLEKERGEWRREGSSFFLYFYSGRDLERDRLLLW